MVKVIIKDRSFSGIIDYSAREIIFPVSAVIMYGLNQVM
jgi:hypothetical protein